MYKGHIFTYSIYMSELKKIRKKEKREKSCEQETLLMCGYLMKMRCVYFPLARKEVDVVVHSFVL